MSILLLLCIHTFSSNTTRCGFKLFDSCCFISSNHSRFVAFAEEMTPSADMRPLPPRLQVVVMTFKGCVFVLSTKRTTPSYLIGSPSITHSFAALVLSSYRGHHASTHRA